MSEIDSEVYDPDDHAAPPVPEVMGYVGMYVWNCVVQLRIERLGELDFRHIG